MALIQGRKEGGKTVESVGVTVTTFRWTLFVLLVATDALLVVRVFETDLLGSGLAGTVAGPAGGEGIESLV